MAETIFAAFGEPAQAEQAAGALLDRGAKPVDISIVIGNVDHTEQSIDGVTTTTAADAGVGAVKGAGWGAGVGVVAALASLFIPGVGLVVGSGALATAIAAGAATLVGGAITGGIVGLLVDQGVSAEQAATYQRIVTGGGAILTLSMPSGELRRDDVDDVVAKYGATEYRAIARNPLPAQP
ncbi:MAG: hypothetical protein JO347_01980 [Candidatus Eremiobacteraeota bacterium]|nr:hypothetical protein [Candidatus Eremiobacteraeota bacterium]